MKRLVLTALLCCAGLLLAPSGYAGIETSKHNLSISGPGDIKALTETRICVFCHIPHNSSPSGPLWNRSDPGQNYTQLYDSTTFDAGPGQPDNTSLLCLSCHDGTIALGSVLSEEDVIAMTVYKLEDTSRRSNLGTDLGDDHPVSFDYSLAATTDGQLVSADQLTGPVKLYKDQYVECTSCHDPHDDTYGDFLVMDAVGGALCESCHIILHADTPHRTSAREWDKNDPNRPNTDWLSVQENACFNCHTPHGAEGRARLLRFADDERNCLVCHNGKVALSDVESVLDKPYVHPMVDETTEGAHDPTEPISVSDGHVECQDCHNGHAVREETGDDTLSGALIDVPGIDINGTLLETITEDYQVCFRCHGGDILNHPIDNTIRLVEEVGAETNVRLDFDFNENPSYHPVAGNRPNSITDVPSLITPTWTVDSIIKCTDCHNNDDSSVRGPHGSNNPHILELNYETMDDTPETSTAYALCYKCHDQGSILRNDSFSRHLEHIDDPNKPGKKATPCNVCHDPHGVQPDGGIGGQHSGVRLLNFDLDVVEPNSSGLLYHEATGDFSGACYLSCHGKNHNPCSYTSTSASCAGGGGGGGGG